MADTTQSQGTAVQRQSKTIGREQATHKRARGRPRDPDIDCAAVAAVRELLAEVGWERTTMMAIADRAGVGRSAIYRRWDSKAHLVFEAVFGGVDKRDAVADVTNLEDWIAKACDYSFDLFSDQAFYAALPGLLLAFAEREELSSELWSAFSAQGVDRLTAVLDCAGDDAASADARAGLTLIVGSMLLSRIVFRGTDANELRQAVPQVLLYGLLPR